MPRLIHHALLPRQDRAQAAVLAALLAEQRRTNRLLQGLVWALLGFVMGVVVTRGALHFWH
jgi:ubiquinone biosynthesis protein